MIFKLLVKKLEDQGLGAPEDFDNLVDLLLRDYGPSLLEMKEYRECKHEFEDAWTDYAHTPHKKCRLCGFRKWEEEK